MTKRDELIEEIEGELPSLPVDGEWVTQASFEQIADFILAREAKMLDEIEKPLKEAKRFWNNCGENVEPFKMRNEMILAINEALSTINRLREE